MSSDTMVFPFIRTPSNPKKRPVLWVSLENPADPERRKMVCPALLDTGADCTVAPRWMCEELGHVFQEGLEHSYVGGIGAGRVMTTRHAIEATVFAPLAGGGIPVAGSMTFFTMKMLMSFMDQDFPMVLLGQADFFHLHKYCQDRHEGWFSLQRVQDLGNHLTE